MRLEAEAHRVASGTMWLTFMQVINYAVAFIFYFLLAKLLSPAEVGVFSLLLSVMAIYNTFTMLALNSAAIKFVSEHLSREETELASAASRRILETTLIVSTPALIVSLALSPFLAGRIGGDSLSLGMALSAAFILNITSYYGGVMYGLGAFRAVAFQNVIYYVTSRFSAIALAFIGLGTYGLMNGFLLGAVFCLAFSFLAVRGKLKHGKNRGEYRFGRILSFSAPIYANNIILLAQGWLDVIVLSAVAGLTQTGVYYMAVASVGFLSVLWAPLASTLFPTFSSLYGAKRKETLENALATSLRITTFTVLPVSLALAAVSPTALALVYGESYGQVAPSFMLLTSFSIFSAYSAIYTASLQALGETKPIFTAGAVSVAVYALALSILPTHFGPLGAAVSRTLLGLVCFVILHLSTSRRTKLLLNVNLIAKTLSLSAVLALPLMLLDQHWNTSLHLRGAVEAAMFAILWILGTKLFRPLNHEDTNIIKAALPAKLRFITKVLV